MNTPLWLSVVGGESHDSHVTTNASSLITWFVRCPDKVLLREGLLCQQRHWGQVGIQVTAQCMHHNLGVGVISQMHCDMLAVCGTLHSSCTWLSVGRSMAHCRPFHSAPPFHLNSFRQPSPPKSGGKEVYGMKNWSGANPVTVQGWDHT